MNIMVLGACESIAKFKLINLLKEKGLWEKGGLNKTNCFKDKNGDKWYYKSIYVNSCIPRTNIAYIDINIKDSLLKHVINDFATLPPYEINFF